MQANENSFRYSLFAMYRKTNKEKSITASGSKDGTCTLFTGLGDRDEFLAVVP